ncbi:hypothetical protein L1987_06462 [Smallanthus sonchifolius]|uniref:Uncharacterized protein n=1 Tax=Smallanthus sonchifolius TaxID=185202 RepID=A0ACB9JYC5_9ASTR|nr:hypothetical protein L1987_06462 [Smallanthus sonchifolius]
MVVVVGCRGEGKGEKQWSWGHDKEDDYAYSSRAWRDVGGCHGDNLSMGWLCGRHTVARSGAWREPTRRGNEGAKRRRGQRSASTIRKLAMVVVVGCRGEGKGERSDGHGGMTRKTLVHSAAKQGGTWEAVMATTGHGGGYAGDIRWHATVHGGS